MNRFTEYTVDSGRRASCRRADSPTRTPSGVNATMDGSSVRPSPSGMIRGKPVVSSTYATRLFVVPRSMPMMRDTLVLLSQRLRQVVDDRPQIGARRERGLDPREHGGTLAGGGRIPRLAELGAHALFLDPPSRGEPLPLLGERGAAGGVQSARAQVGQRLLDLEHLLQQLRWRLGLHRRAFPRVTAFFQPHDVL